MANVLCRGSGKCLADSNSNSNLKTLFYKDCSLGSGAGGGVFYVGAVRCGKCFM